jgi:pSer/pThr/pTyr-binding forkhead associated (FHA) protein
MSVSAQGELVPVGGGDAIPLVRSTLSIGRRETCDVCLRFSNVSSKHCELYFNEGFWFVRDLGSTNGTRVNGKRITQKKLLRPGDLVTVAKQKFTITYHIPIGQEVVVDTGDEEDINQPLLEKAGLARPKHLDKVTFRPHQDGKPGFLAPEKDDDDDFDDDDD